jgi:hypothetical protein
MAYTKVIWVSPLANGWTVRCAELEPLVFRSGRRAEEQARALARCLSDLGSPAQVRIQDRSMNLIGAQDFPAA